MPKIRFLLLFAVLSGQCMSMDFVTRCLRTPDGMHAQKTPGDGAIHISIAGSPKKYIPGVEYTITLGYQRRSSYVLQTFTRFMLVVEPDNQPLEYDLRKTGLFTPLRDAMTKTSSYCPNAVIETSSAPKYEIQVLWTAPIPDSGCVIFKATVVEDLKTWYMDDGDLSVTLCEEDDEDIGIDDQPPILAECCACEEAKYELAFEGLWSRQTHPKDFPLNKWSTHFSDLVGASHSADYAMWDYGAMATEPLRHIAEMEMSALLEAELKRRWRDVRTIILARGLRPANLDDRVKTVFRVDRKNHLLSFVSKMFPSPDWIVGVSKLELCQKNCSWLDEKVMNLYPVDIGTDSGYTYAITSKSPTIPRDRIRLITPSFPIDSPFYDPDGEPLKPVARITVSRQRLYDNGCAVQRPNYDLYPNAVGFPSHTWTGGGENGGDEDNPSLSADICLLPRDNGPCRTTETRWYFESRKGRCYPFSYGGCQGNDNNFHSMEDCMNTCSRRGSEHEVFGGDNDDQSGRIDCQMSEWTAWSQCSATCGRGRVEKTRYIEIHPRNGGSECPEKLRIRRKCNLQPCNKYQDDYGQPEAHSMDHSEASRIITAQHRYYDDTDDEYPPSQHTRRKAEDCVLGVWSDWSECSKSCGPHAVQERFRQEILPARNGGKPCDHKTVFRSCSLPSCTNGNSQEDEYED